MLRGHSTRIALVLAAVVATSAAAPAYAVATSARPATPRASSAPASTDASRASAQASPPPSTSPAAPQAADDPFAPVVAASVAQIREHAAWLLKDHPSWIDHLRRTYASLRAKATDATGLDESAAARALDESLRRASAGTARFLTPADQEYLALASKFSGALHAERYRQIGAWFERRGKRWFVRDVFAGGPAARAGLTRGDEIVTVDGRPLAPVGAFLAITHAKLTYRRLPWEAPKSVEIATLSASVQELLLEAMRASLRVSQRRDKSVGYLWLPAASHTAFRDLLHDALASLQREAASLVLDLRGDFGGGDLTYADALLGTQPVFRKPMVVLVDSGTRGGREGLARLLQKAGRAVVVGSATAGDAAPGLAVPLTAPAGALYLPSRPPNPEARVLPDVPVDAPLVYAAGADPALIAALDAAIQD